MQEIQCFKKITLKAELKISYTQRSVFDEVPGVWYCYEALFQLLKNVLSGREEENRKENG